MPSVRAMANLFCSSCREYTLHTANVCPCGARNTASGNPPIPRPPKPYGNQTTRASRARIEGFAARSRARAARHQVMNQRGRA